MAELDYAAVRRYWNKAQPSILGPYMMEGFGFPPAAGLFRFNGERDIVRRLVQSLDRTGTVLDLGSGVGVWAEEFARHFAQVVAVEASTPLCDALRVRCGPMFAWCTGMSGHLNPTIDTTSCFSAAC
jgi:hypothetical protein